MMRFKSHDDVTGLQRTADRCPRWGTTSCTSGTSGFTLTQTLTLILTLNPNSNPIQNALVYISFCAALIKSDYRALGHDSIDE